METTRRGFFWLVAGAVAATTAKSDPWESMRGAMRDMDTGTRLLPSRPALSLYRRSGDVAVGDVVALDPSSFTVRKMTGSERPFGIAAAVDAPEATGPNVVVLLRRQEIIRL